MQGWRAGPTDHWPTSLYNMLFSSCSCPYSYNSLYERRLTNSQPEALWLSLRLACSLSTLPPHYSIWHTIPFCLFLLSFPLLPDSPTQSLFLSLMLPLFSLWLPPHMSVHPHTCTLSRPHTSSNKIRERMNKIRFEVQRLCLKLMIVNIKEEKQDGSSIIILPIDFLLLPLKGKATWYLKWAINKVQHDITGYLFCSARCQAPRIKDLI